SHSPCSNGILPTDISAGSYSTLYLYANGEIRSFYVAHETSCAPSSDCSADHKRALKIHLYHKQNYCCEIGWILFGHVRSPLSAGWYNYTPSGVVLGNVPPGTCTYYSGGHSHMEAHGHIGV